eukprot:NODE_3705_length_338_cov_318.529412_g3034_i0.p1 GENE.NODE_3705_length_338_cov_318.529412_g3034_i0~~NODE_3705_length_338_cov_318.529412_g3034_i0.p1  ORF type:complete len:56 (+),score=10.74 NODE_3705_length_338_cov_318.529412_g3034_i0:67-234(+)
MPKDKKEVDPAHLEDDMVEDPETDGAVNKATAGSKSGGKTETGKHAPHKDRSVNM